MKPAILLVEDDHDQLADACAAITRVLDVEIRTKAGAFEFRRDFEKIATSPPAVAILDIMLRWGNPAPDMDQPPAGFSSDTAGLFCAKLLREDSRTSGVHVLLYSVLPKGDLGEEPPAGVECVIKELNFQNLIEKLRQLLPLRK